MVSRSSRPCLSRARVSIRTRTRAGGSGARAARSSGSLTKPRPSSSSACSIRTSREGSSATTRGGPSARPRSRPRARTRSALMTARLSRSSRRTTCCASPSRWSSAPSSVRSCARTRRCARPLPRAPKRARRSRSRSAALRGARARVRRSLRRRSARSRASGSMWLAPWTSRQKLRWRRRRARRRRSWCYSASHERACLSALAPRSPPLSRILATAEDAQGSRPIYRYMGTAVL